MRERERETPLSRVRSLPPTTEKESQTPPVPPPRKTRPPGHDPWNLEGNLKGMIAEPRTNLAGAGEKRWEIVEAGLGDIKKGEGELPVGWEWIWVEDP